MLSLNHKLDHFLKPKLVFTQSRFAGKPGPTRPQYLFTGKLVLGPDSSTHSQPCARGAFLCVVSSAVHAFTALKAG